MEGFLKVLQLGLYSVFLAGLYFLERAKPFYKGRGLMVEHGFYNILVGAFASGIAVTFHLMYGWVGYFDWALLPKVGLSGFWLFPAGVIALDLWMYVWHRLNHRLGFFWRFHRAHHSDPFMDVSTAVRFHPGEIFFSSFFLFFVLSFLGLQVPHLLAYEILQIPVVFFHHSNVDLDRRSERLMRTVFVSPYIHRIHHSRLYLENNSNFSSVFSVWDRVFKTLRYDVAEEKIVFGLDSLGDVRHHSLKGILLTPFVK